MEWDKVKAELQKPLNPDAINPPPKGKFGEYVSGLHVMREANRIFGENGWSYTVTRLEQTHSEIVDLTYNGETKKQLRTSFLCSVRVDIDGVIREGLAVGTGNGKPENAGDVIESAVKEAETDALKRALRTFGNTFGLALYEKDKSKREVGVELDPEQEAKAIQGKADNFKAGMLRDINNARDLATIEMIGNHPKYAVDLDELHAMNVDAANSVRAQFETRKEELTQKEKAA